MYSILARLRSEGASATFRLSDGSILEGVITGISIDPDGSCAVLVDRSWISIAHLAMVTRR